MKNRCTNYTFELLSDKNYHLFLDSKTSLYCHNLFSQNYRSYKLVLTRFYNKLRETLKKDFKNCSDN